MDRLADLGSGWACGALRAAGLYSLEMQVCGSTVSRYAIGLTAVAALALMAGVAATYFLVGRPR